MAFTFGFYDSRNGDRKYNSIQMSEIFDGLIGDGVYETIGQKFRVTVSEGTEIKVGTGRAWFNHTWNLNDSIMIVDCGESEILLDRIDAVVIEVDRTIAKRENSIKVIHGTPSTSPERPKLSNDNDLYQYPLAYIYRSAGSETITLADIVNMVGTSECPFVIGIIKTMDIDMFIEQWAAQWNLWLDRRKDEFNTWFNSLQVLLSGDVAGNLANEILKINSVIDTLAKEHRIYRNILDEENNAIVDDSNDPILGSIIFCTSPCDCNKIIK